jgi:hypothetical protein
MPRLTLPQSVGQQVVHCFTAQRVNDTKALADAKRLQDKGTLAESKLRKLRDLLHEHQPQSGQQVALFQKAIRGLGMTMTRQRQGGR